MSGDRRKHGLVLRILAQTEVDPKPAIDAVRKAAFLEGKWSGEGWIRMGSGLKHEFMHMETVESKLDGAVVLIEGVGQSKEGEPKTVYHATAAVSFDLAGNSLVFPSFMMVYTKKVGERELGVPADD